MKKKLTVDWISAERYNRAHGITDANVAYRAFVQECQSDDVLERSILAHVDSITNDFLTLWAMGLELPTVERKSESIFSEARRARYCEPGQSLAIVVLVLVIIALLILAAGADSGQASNVSMELCHAVSRCQW